MKVNQNDLIISIVAVVLGLGFSAAFFFLQRKPIVVAQPQNVVTTAPALPVGSVVMANALPGAGNAAGGGGGFGGPGAGPGGPGLSGPAAMGASSMGAGPGSGGGGGGTPPGYGAPPGGMMSR